MGLFSGVCEPLSNISAVVVAETGRAYTMNALMSHHTRVKIVCSTLAPRKQWAIPIYICNIAQTQTGWFRRDTRHDMAQRYNQALKEKLLKELSLLRENPYIVGTMQPPNEAANIKLLLGNLRNSLSTLAEKKTKENTNVS